MLEGWLAVGMSPQGVTVIDPRPSEAMTRLCNERGIALNPTNPPAAPEVLVLGIKPQGLDEAAPPTDSSLPPPPTPHLSGGGSRGGGRSARRRAPRGRPLPRPGARGWDPPPLP